MSQTALGINKSRDIAKSSISRLNFNLESSVVSEVNKAKRKFTFLKSCLPFHQVICDNFDSDLIKRRKLSSEFIVKLTVQLNVFIHFINILNLISI